MSHSFDMRHRTRTTILRLLVSGCLVILAACGPSHNAQPTGAKGESASVKRYQLTGRVVSIDKPAQSVNIDGDEIPGFMAAMTMPYPVKDAAVLDKLSPGDQIKAEIVLGNEGAYLENIGLTKKAPSPKPTK
ncbi:MAG TPA: copper-binding protein [Chthoniobacterales bacterium]|nr:copper-binding protein [Chthoniobacterales bacterium]